MTDKTHPDSGSTNIIRYALELGLLWIDGSGRDKVREALDALDALEAQLASIGASIGAGGVQALSAAPAEVMKWPKDASEVREFMHTHCITEQYAVGIESPSDDDKYLLSAHDFLSAVNWWADFPHYQAASPTPPAEQPAPNTGHAEADRLIGRLMSSDPDFEDCRQAAELIQREIKGPDGFGTWREAAIAERLTRVNQQAAPKAAPGELAESATKDAIMGAAYDFRDAHISGSMNLKRSAHAILEAAVDNALAAQSAPQPAPAHPACKSDMLVNGGALVLALAVLRRAGKTEVADELAKTAQPAPLSDDVVKDAARYRWLREGNDAKHGAAWHVAVNLYGCEWDAAIDAARAAQGGE